MAILQPMVSDPQNIGIYVTMDTIVDEVCSEKDKLIHRAVANYESCISRLGSFARDPTVCRRFLDITFEHFPSYVDDVTTKLLDLLDNDDTSVLLYLVDRLIEYGDIGYASSVYNGLGKGQDLAMREFVLGRFASDIGNLKEAKQHFIRTILTEPSFYRAYSYLDELDPSYGWVHIANISLVMNGKDPIIGEGSINGEREDLLHICDQWAKGDWKGSLAAMRRSPLFIRKDPFTLALFAWMSVKVGSHQDAVESYLGALEVLKDSEYLSVELASLYSAVGDYDSSTALLRRMSVFNPHSPRLLASKFISLMNDGRRQDANRVLDALMSSAGLDAELLGGCIAVLRSHGMTMEATNLTRRVSARCIDRAYAEYLLASDDMARGNFRSVISHANAALRVDKGYTRARCLRAKAYLKIDGVTKAMQDVNRMLDDSPDDMMVLDVKKDIHTAIGHYEDSLAICELMLSIDPRNVDVMMDRAVVLGLMGDFKNSLDSYREAINIEGDFQRFVSILRELLRQRRVSDLCRLVDDFDDVFGRSAIIWRLRGNAEYVDGRYEDAVASYERAVQLAPNDGEIWHSKGLAEEATGSYEDAEDSFGRALLSDLENGEYWISKAVVQEKRGNLRGAIVSLNKVITSANNGVFPLTMKARILSKCGRARESVYFLDQAQRMEPNNVQIMHMIKDTYMHLGEYGKAVAVCRTILNIVKTDDDITADLITAHIANGDRVVATELLIKLIGKPDLSLQVLSKCASAFHSLSDFGTESHILERALRLAPDDRSIMVRLAEAYIVSGNKAKAIETYARMEEHDPKDMTVTVKRAMLDASTDEKASEPMEDVAEDVNGLMVLAQRKSESGDEDGALHIYRRVMDSDPDRVDAYVASMDILMRMGKAVDVIAMASDSSHLFPNDGRVLKVLGDAYVHVGENERAVEAYTGAMRIGMDTAEIHGSVGHALEALGMMQMALDNYRAAMEREPQNVEHRLDLASLEVKVGHEDVAMPLLESVLTTDPHNIRALRTYVSICDGRNDSEAILALFDDMMDAAVMEEDIRFFESVLRDIGENSKADRMASKLTS